MWFLFSRITTFLLSVSAYSRAITAPLSPHPTIKMSLSVASLTSLAVPSLVITEILQRKSKIAAATKKHLRLTQELGGKPLPILFRLSKFFATRGNLRCLGSIRFENLQRTEKRSMRDTSRRREKQTRRQETTGSTTIGSPTQNNKLYFFLPLATAILFKAC